MIHLTNISKQHGFSGPVQRGPACRFSPATRTGLVGPNGAGKSSIFRLITGEEEADSGDISCSSKTVHRLLLSGCRRYGRTKAYLTRFMSAAGEIMELGPSDARDGNADELAHG